MDSIGNFLCTIGHNGVKPLSSVEQCSMFNQLAAAAVSPWVARLIADIVVRDTASKEEKQGPTTPRSKP